MQELNQIQFFMVYKIPPRGKGKKLKWTRGKTKSTELIEKTKQAKHYSQVIDGKLKNVKL